MIPGLIKTVKVLNFLVIKRPLIREIFKSQGYTVPYPVPVVSELRQIDIKATTTMSLKQSGNLQRRNQRSVSSSSLLQMKVVGWAIGICHVNDGGLIPQDEVLETKLIDETRIFVWISTPQGITKNWTLKLRGHLKPETSIL